MKAVSLLIMGTTFAIAAKAQTVSLITNKDIRLKETSTKGLTDIDITKSNTTSQDVLLSFKITNISADEVIVLTTAAVDVEGSAKYTPDKPETSDYTYANGSIGTKNLPLPVNGIQTFNIEINKTTTKSTNAVFTINIKNTDKKLDKTFKVKVNFNCDDGLVNKGKNNSADTSKWSIKLVAGSNFDFFNSSPKFQNFAGEFNVSTPNFYGKWGVNFSLYNYHYTQSDSSQSFHSSDYYFLNPQDYYNKTDSTRKIVKRSYSVNRKADNNIWGAFIEPVYELIDDDFAQLYCSVHIEGVLTTITYTPTFTYTSKDTVAANLLSPIQRGVALAHPAIPSTYTQGTFYDVYLGAGLPLKLNIANQFRVSVASTAGIAFIQENFPPSNLDYQERFSYSNPTLNKMFFLTKFQIVSSVAAVDVAIGGEYRVVIGNLHYLTTYVAASIPLDKLLKK